MTLVSPRIDADGKGTKLERMNEMTEDRIAQAIDRRSRAQMDRQHADTRSPAGVIMNLFRTSATQEDVDDKARWLDGQVRGWTAGRTL